MDVQDKIAKIGELLYDLSLQRKEGDIIVVRSDDENFSDLTISEIENIFSAISEDSGAFAGYEKTETVDGGGKPIIKFAMLIDDQLLRDYLIESYGNDFKADVQSIKSMQDEYMDNEILYWITFDDTGRIILNDDFILAKTQAGSNSDSLMDYVFKHPNKICTKEEIQKAYMITEKIERAMPKTVDELGFRGELKKMFFKVSKDKAIFRNPITRKQLRSLNINENKLKLQISSLKLLK